MGNTRLDEETFYAILDNILHTTALNNVIFRFQDNEFLSMFYTAEADMQTLGNSLLSSINQMKLYLKKYDFFIKYHSFDPKIPQLLDILEYILKAKNGGGVSACKIKYSKGADLYYIFISAYNKNSMSEHRNLQIALYEAIYKLSSQFL